MKRIGVPLLLILSLTGLIIGTPRPALADSASDIQSQIDANNAQMQSIEADIAAYQQQLDALASQKSTLQSTINSLTLSQKQLAAQIKLTQNKISGATLQIQQLSDSIAQKQTSISGDQAAISSALRTIDENEQISIVTQLLSTNSLGDAWNSLDQMAQFNQALSNNIVNLQSANVVLSSNRDQISAAKAQLVSLQNVLALQKRAVDANKGTQQQLLAQTNDKEANYEKLIEQKQASEASFEQELVNLQGQLHLTVNPYLLPKVGTGVLAWPFSLAYMFSCSQRQSVFGNLFCITQYFGNTPFSTANPQIYSGHGHDGIDIAAPIGTPVQAALAGTVLATGDTDLVHDSEGRQCYSFGKWVMLEHSNGINTMYAHLSVISVEKGQSVGQGQVLGLSGMTGYATGPHLHFGVYATQGTEIMTLRQFRGATIGCADATMPVATLTAYLNPLSYL